MTHACIVTYNNLIHSQIEYVKVTSPTGGYCIIHKGSEFDQLVDRVDNRVVYDQIVWWFDERLSTPLTVYYTFDQMRTLMFLAWETGGTVNSVNHTLIKRH
jgi:hypothetical protein